NAPRYGGTREFPPNTVLSLPSGFYLWKIEADISGSSPTDALAGYFDYADLDVNGDTTDPLGDSARILQQFQADGAHPWDPQRGIEQSGFIHIAQAQHVYAHFYNYNNVSARKLTYFLIFVIRLADTPSGSFSGAASAGSVLSGAESKPSEPGAP